MFHELKAQCFQMAKESHRRADPRHGMQTLPGQLSDGTASARLDEIMESGTLQAHPENLESGSRKHCGRVTVENHRIDPRHALQRLAQRACGQAPAVQYTARIEHGNFDVARQSIVLQSIVAEDYVAVRMRRNQRQSCGDTVCTDEYRTSAVSGKHQCLVAENGRITKGDDRRWAPDTAAVTAGDDSRPSPALA